MIRKYKELEITCYEDVLTGNTFYKMSDVIMFIDSNRYHKIYDWINNNEELNKETIQLTKPEMEAKGVWNGKGMRAVFINHEAFIKIIKEHLIDIEKLTWVNEIFLKKSNECPSKAYKNICELQSSVTSILNMYEPLRQRLSEIDLEICDIEHEIESFNIINGTYALDRISKIRDLRQERRHVKNEMELITPIHNMLLGTTIKVPVLNRLKGEADVVRQRQINWFYRKRV